MKMVDFILIIECPEDGIIGRSLRFDTRNNNGSLGMVSIIIDAYKE